jgi:DnaJ-class molecular chaperone
VRVPLQLTLLEAGRGVERTVAYRSQGGNVKTRVRIPAGVESGATVRVRGKGEAAPPGGTPGDLLLEVGVTKDPRFERDGRTLRTTVPVTVYDAVLGAKVRVPTLNGTATINLPRGTRSGQVFRLRGRGLGPEGSAGDLLAQVIVQPPTDIDDDLVRLMEEFRDSHAYTPDGEAAK